MKTEKSHRKITTDYTPVFNCMLDSQEQNVLTSLGFTIEYESIIAVGTKLQQQLSNTITRLAREEARPLGMIRVCLRSHYFS